MIADAAIPLVVFAFAGVCALSIHGWLARSSDRTDIPEAERFGLCVILAVLLIGFGNNFLSVLLGSLTTAFVLPALMLASAAAVVARKRQPTESRWFDLHAMATCVVCPLFLLAIAGKLFFFGELSRLGLLYADLPWHIGRVTEQAFLSTPGFWPLSPIAFPGALPFQAFVADALVSATFRALPFSLYAFNYSQALFCWAIVLWIAVALVAGPGMWRSLVVMTTALLAVPALLYGPDHVGSILYVFLHANPNSLIAWPIGLALSMHVYGSFRRATLPWAPALLLIPPASLFFKPNIAVSFAWLEAAGFAVWLWRGRNRNAWRWIAFGSALWAIAILGSHAIGPWPVSAGVRPALSNFIHYALVAFGHPKVSRVLIQWPLDAVAAIGIAIAAANVGAGVNDTPPTPRRDAVVLLAALTAAVAYVGLGWWLVVPTGPSEGEPMHVNFELIMWLVTVLAVAALCGDRASHRTRWPAARLAASWIVLGLGALMARSVQHPPPAPGSLTPSLHDYERTAEARVRNLAAPSIPGGSCFWYGRWYAIDVAEPLNPDFTMAATGCPVINGKRWRGHLGDNRLDQLRGRPTIDVPAGSPFTLVRLTDR